jgi:hypothetical protein
MKTGKIFFTLGFSLATLIGESQVPPPPPPPPPPPHLPSAATDNSARADSLVFEGEIRHALEEYAKLVKLNPQNRRLIYNYSCLLSVDHQADSAFRYLYIAISKEPSERVFTDPDLINLREDSRWRDLEDYNIRMINLRTGKTVKDTSYARKLWKMLCLDQYSFYETSLAARKLGPDSPVVSALRRLQDMKNANNLRELEVLLTVKGWPERSKVGSEAASAAFYILQHSNATAQEKYLPLFEKACRANEGDWRQYALMFDRMRMNRNKPQRFGTHAYMDPRAGKTNHLYPLEDELRVDEWRKEIGLEPLDEYLRKSGIEYKPSTPGK